MSDLIRREDAISVVNAICERCGKYKEYDGVMCGTCALDGVEDSIEDLPSAVPTPHGNLVDLDAMVDKFWDGDYMEIHCRDLDDIPIIVEAEADHE